MRFPFGLFAFAAVFHASAIPPLDSLKVKLNGGWDWVSTTGGSGGQTKTPLTEHYTCAMVFLKNSPNFESDSIGYQLYWNKTLTVSAIAPIKRRKWGQDTVWTIGIGYRGPVCCRTEFLILKITDTLVLGDGVVDGYVSRYVKKAASIKNSPGACPSSWNFARPAGSSDCFTVLGRRLARRWDGERPIAAQIVASRSKAGVAGLPKNGRDCSGCR